MFHGNDRGQQMTKAYFIFGPEQADHVARIAFFYFCLISYIQQT
jgi:hypothetical protein